MACNLAITIVTARLAMEPLTPTELEVAAQHLRTLPLLTHSTVQRIAYGVQITSGEIVVTWLSNSLGISGPAWMDAAMRTAITQHANAIAATLNVARRSDQIAHLLSPLGSVTAETVAYTDPDGVAALGRRLTAQASGGVIVRVLLGQGGRMELAVDGAISEADATALSVRLLTQMRAAGVPFASMGAVELHRTGAAHSHVRNEVRHG